MKAKILPLNGKYYGTNIEIIDDHDNLYGFKLWSGRNEPSDREFGGKCTIEQWRNNEILPLSNGWTDKIGIEAQEYFEICDSHFESRDTYELAQKIVNLINKEEVK